MRIILRHQMTRSRREPIHRRIMIMILACLVGLWMATASAQNKFNPNQAPNPIVKQQPPAAPPPTAPPPVVKLPPPTSPSAPTGSPVIEPKVPPGTLPVDSTGGRFGDRERQAAEAARDAAAAGQLEKELGIDAAMGTGPSDDSLMGGAGIQANDPFSELCKRPMFQQFPMCAGRGQSGGGLPSDGNLSSFYDTKRPVPSATDPGGKLSFDGQRAGSGVPSRGGQASEDRTEMEESPDGMSSHYSWSDQEGHHHDLWISVEGAHPDGNCHGDCTVHALHEVHNKDGTFNHSDQRVETPDRSRGAHSGDYVAHTTHRTTTGLELHTTQHCRGSACTPDSQPGESGYGQIKARAWFCARNPNAKGCGPTAPGSQIDPANPDGEGTSSTRPRTETPRLGRGAVSDPGPADSEIRGTTGGGSKPLDIVDPINPDRPR